MDKPQSKNLYKEKKDLQNINKNFFKKNSEKLKIGKKEINCKSSIKFKCKINCPNNYNSAINNKINMNCENINQTEKLLSQNYEMNPATNLQTKKKALAQIKPVVDKYSITRYSEEEWRQRNSDILKNMINAQQQSNIVTFNGKKCIESLCNKVDQNAAETTKLLDNRTKQIHFWKCELERSIDTLKDEIELLVVQKNRLKQAISTMNMLELITQECVFLRTGRIDQELVRDQVEEYLLKELDLINEIKNLYGSTLNDVDQQLVENKASKSKLEENWSDKYKAHQTDAKNTALNLRSNTLMLKPGCTRFIAEQTTPDYWEHYTKEIIGESEVVQQRSVKLRSTLNGVLLNSARDLQTLCDKVNEELSKRIDCTQEILYQLQEKLKQILIQFGELETLVNNLTLTIRQIERAMKLAQTRLDMRNKYRDGVENCRDEAQNELIDEIKTLEGQLQTAKANFKEVDDARIACLNSRSELEREVMLKLKSIEIDRNRCQLIRNFYPSIQALSGYKKL